MQHGGSIRMPTLGYASGTEAGKARDKRQERNAKAHSAKPKSKNSYRKARNYGPSIEDKDE
jgi:hypothetical protein